MLLRLTLSLNPLLLLSLWLPLPLSNECVSVAAPRNLAKE